MEGRVVRWSKLQYECNVCKGPHADIEIQTVHRGWTHGYHYHFQCMPDDVRKWWVNEQQSWHDTITTPPGK